MLGDRQAARETEQNKWARSRAESAAAEFGSTIRFAPESTLEHVLWTSCGDLNETKWRANLYELRNHHGMALEIESWLNLGKVLGYYDPELDDTEDAVEMTDIYGEKWEFSQAWDYQIRLTIKRCINGAPEVAAWSVMQDLHPLIGYDVAELMVEAYKVGLVQE
jgi:hypothetical protein